MNFDRDKYADLFRDESAEQIEDLNQNLLRLEREGALPEIVNEIFRVAHTLKSSAAFVGLDRLSELSHVMEDVLQQVKLRNIDVTTELVTTLFSCLDRLRASVQSYVPGTPEKDDFQDLKNALRSYASSGHEPPAGAAEVNAAPAPLPPSGDDADLGPQKISIQLTPAEERELIRLAGGKTIFDGYVRLEQDAPMKNMRLLLLIQHLLRSGTVARSIPDQDSLETGAQTNELHFTFYGDMSKNDLLHLCQIDMVEEVRVAPRIHAREGGAIEESRVQTRSIKVSSEKIDYLMNNVGELVITNSGLLNILEEMRTAYGESHLLGELKNRIDQAGRIARDLQSGIMKTRMIPIGLSFHRFTRPVRDLALELNKEVDLVFFGEDTELDKNIIDAIHEPFLHLLRNSLDHGIESPEEREAAGKPRRGTIELSAYQSGNNIYVQISDDGRGLDRRVIWQKAQETGLATSADMPDDDNLFSFVFQPGFSTARTVTDLSGRGVGMNVVQKMVDDFNGTIQVQSEAGLGTTMTMSFPLTLAIISAVLVTIAGEEFAFPLSDIVETIRIRRDEITTLQARDIINLRGEILPIFSTGPILGLFSESAAEEFPVMITSVGNRKVGFAVDSLTGKAEIVIKSLEQNYRPVRGLVGACLMGDGRIVLVLDVQGLVELVQKDSSRDPSLKALDYLAAMELETTAAVRAYNEGVAKMTVRRLDEKKRIKKETPVEKSAVEQTLALKLETSAILENKSAGVPPTTPVGSGEMRGTGAANSAQDVHATVPDPAPSLPAVKIDILSDDEYSRVHTVISAGMTSAGMVLSQLLGIKIDVAVPEFNALNFADLPGYMPPGDTICVSVGTEGKTHAHLFLVFDETTGYQAAGDLLGLPTENWNAAHISTEDLSGVLCELANIVGASILNSLANKAGHAITPTVPDFSRARGAQVASDITLLASRDENLHLLYISADFFRQDMDLLARLFFLIPRDVLMSVAGRT